MKRYIWLLFALSGVTFTGCSGDGTTNPWWYGSSNATTAPMAPMPNTTFQNDTSTMKNQTQAQGINKDWSHTSEHSTSNNYWNNDGTHVTKTHSTSTTTSGSVNADTGGMISAAGNLISSFLK